MTGNKKNIHNNKEKNSIQNKMIIVIQEHL